MYMITAFGPGLLLCAITPLAFILVLPLVRKPGRYVFLQSEAAASAISLLFSLIVGMGVVLGMRNLLAVNVGFTEALLLPPAVMVLSAIVSWSALRAGNRFRRPDRTMVPPASGLAAH